MAEIIDAHHHLWRYTQAEFGWINQEMNALQRDFVQDDLMHEISTVGIHGTVVVQARQSVQETRWLLSCAASTPAIRGVVGWLPLASPELPALLAEFAQQGKLKGLRHVLQDEPDDGFILSKSFNAGVALLLDTGLAYDMLIRECQLPNAAVFARQHPAQQIVLDHLAKPKIAAAELEPWRTNLMRLAECPNVSCKLSGLVTEAYWNSWTLDDLRPYLSIALEAFGADRLMAGSDWPVCLVATSYKRWWSALYEWSQDLKIDQQEAIFGGTANRFYALTSRQNVATAEQA